MLYLNKSDIQNVGIDWNREINVIEKAVKCLEKGDFSQPIKPYLRFGDEANRIIAMPAFVGGDVNIAGIKWIASFPNNIEKGVPRANSVTVLNHADTGQPIALINTALISIIRTAAVSGLVVRWFDRVNPLHKVSIGIVGFGPIGQYHLKMLCSLLNERIDKIYLYDIKGIQANDELSHLKDKLVICDKWEDVYKNADIFVTCTVSKKGYIDKKPKDKSLLLNVSLRDYKPEILNYTKSIIVDNWEEVCREQTDIEQMHLKMGLQKEQTYSIIDIVNQEVIANNREEAIMFNPMGMAVFDVSMASHFFELAVKHQIGLQLES